MRQMRLANTRVRLCVSWSDRGGTRYTIQGADSGQATADALDSILAAVPALQTLRSSLSLASPPPVPVLLDTSKHARTQIQEGRAPVRDRPAEEGRGRHCLMVLSEGEEASEGDGDVEMEVDGLVKTMKVDLGQKRKG
jgi:hypothetical protein